MAFFWIRKKVHWSDTDAAGIVWFANFLRWFEDAEEELFAALGDPRQALLDRLHFGMPRVETHTKFHSPIRAGDLIRIGISSRVENARRLRHDFEMREDSSDRLVASGSVRVACVDLSTFAPRDLPKDVVRLINSLPALIQRQACGESDIPWT